MRLVRCEMTTGVKRQLALWHDLYRDVGLNEGALAKILKETEEITQ